MTGPDSFFADDDTSINQMMLLKMRIAELEGENATLRTTARSLAKWYEGQERLREALEIIANGAEGVYGMRAHEYKKIAKEALQNHNAATPLWGPLLDCMEKK